MVCKRIKKYTGFPLNLLISCFLHLPTGTVADQPQRNFFLILKMFLSFYRNVLTLGSGENVQGYFRRLPSISVFVINKSKHAETGL
jgi:hypothetical protein